MATLSVYNFKNVVLSKRRFFLKNDYCLMFYAMHKFEYSGVHVARTWTFCDRRTQIPHGGFVSQTRVQCLTFLHALEDFTIGSCNRVNCKMENFVNRTIEGSNVANCTIDKKLLSYKLHDTILLSEKLHDRMKVSCKWHDSILLICKLLSSKLLLCKLHDIIVLSWNLHDEKLIFCNLGDTLLLSWKLSDSKLVLRTIERGSLASCTIEHCLESCYLANKGLKAQRRVRY